MPKTQFGQFTDDQTAILWKLTIVLLSLGPTTGLSRFLEIGIETHNRGILRALSNSSLIIA